MQIELTKKVKLIKGRAGHVLVINPDGSINANIVIGPDDDGVFEFGEKTSLAKDTEETVVLYTVPLGKRFLFLGAFASGCIDGEFKLSFNNVKAGQRYNSWQQRNVDFNIEKVIEAEQQVKITVSHWDNDDFDFQGTIWGKLF